MKPFDLKAALNGTPITHAPNDGIAGMFEGRLIHFDESTGYVMYQLGDDVPRVNSLQYLENFFVMVPKKRTVWVNLYSDGEAFYHYTQEEADDLDSGAKEDRIGGKAYPVEIEE